MKGVQTFHISGIKGARPFPLFGLHFEGIKGSLVEAESVNAKLEIHQSEAVVWLSCPGADIKDSWVHTHCTYCGCLKGFVSWDTPFFSLFFLEVCLHTRSGTRSKPKQSEDMWVQSSDPAGQWFPVHLSH